MFQSASPWTACSDYSSAQTNVLRKGASSAARIIEWLVCVGLVMAAARSDAASAAVWLDELDLSQMRQGWGTPQTNRSVRGQPLTIAGQRFERGVGTHANSAFWLDLAGATDRFRAIVGVDDAAGGPASIVFRVSGDGRLLWESGVMKPGQPAKTVDLPLTGIQALLLQVRDAGDGISFDHANWAEAQFETRGTPPTPRATLREEPVILTPPPPLAPRMRGPAVYGCRPGSPFLYRIPTTGERPIRFQVRRLPAGLILDAEKGILSGSAPARGEYELHLTARNRHGRHARTFRIVSGDRLALTPPMGWNHWYAHYDRVTDTMMREAADVMVSSGMADVGYQYVNIDDCWMNAQKHGDPLRVGPLRDAQGNMIPNRHFPDMKALTDYIHSHGLKAGLYTSPGPRTCAGFAGSHQFEAQDARLYADWGFDFLKYDWCSYDEVVKGDHSLPVLKKPYQLMGDVLRGLDRDVVFNLCQYGMGDVWEWGAAVGGHCWRTAGDLGFELDRVFEVALKNAEHRAHSRPGEWNDPDYIQIGHIGHAQTTGLPQPCPLTPTEQYSFMSLWSLMAAPLFYSGDMSRLDAFTLNVLCNPEVIDIDQDPLGQCARVVPLTSETFLMVKEMADGSKAMGLCNQGEMATTVTVNWSDLGLHGRWTVRDVWRHKDLGRFADGFSTNVPRRGVFLIRVKR